MKTSNPLNLDLTNTQNITELDHMVPYTTAVTNYIESNNLPSFSYPEVYEFMVVQLELTVEKWRETLVFNLGDNFRYCSVEQYHELAVRIRELDNAKELFFQVRNGDQ